MPASFTHFSFTRRTSNQLINGLFSTCPHVFVGPNYLQLLEASSQLMRNQQVDRRFVLYTLKIILRKGSEALSQIKTWKRNSSNFLLWKLLLISCCGNHLSYFLRYQKLRWAWLEIETIAFHSFPKLLVWVAEEKKWLSPLPFIKQRLKPFICPCPS